MGRGGGASTAAIRAGQVDHDYRTLDHGIPLGEASAEYDWWIVSAPALAAELTAAGMTVTTTGDGLVVASGAARPA